MVGNQACFSFYSPVVVDAPPSHGKYSDFRLRNAVGTTARNISERRRYSTRLLFSGRRRDSGGANPRMGNIPISACVTRLEQPRGIFQSGADAAPFCSCRMRRRDSEPPRAPTYILNQKIKALALPCVQRTHGGVHHRKNTTQKKTDHRWWSVFFCGAPSGIRTRDPLIKSQLLYQLS